MQTVESFYIMWRTTGDEVWRERGWAVFQAIEREAKTKSGYTSLLNVEKSHGNVKDEMPRCVTCGWWSRILTERGHVQLFPRRDVRVSALNG